MKGFHDTIDRHRDDRDGDRWKEEGTACEDILDRYLSKEDLSEEEYDTLIVPSQIKKKLTDLIMPAPTYLMIWKF